MICLKRLNTKKVMPVGEWNTSRIVYNNGHVEHYLNGEKTVEFDEGSEEYNKRYQSSKWVGYPDWNKSKQEQFHCRITVRRCTSVRSKFVLFKIH